MEFRALDLDEILEQLVESAGNAQHVRKIASHIPASSVAIFKLAEICRVHSEPLPIYEILADLCAACSCEQVEGIRGALDHKRETEAKKMTDIALEVGLELIEADRENLVPVLGALSNVPFNRKQRNMMVDICLDALELVEEADVPTVARTMLKMASTRIKVKQSFKAIRSFCSQAYIKSKNSVSFSIVILISEIVVQAISSLSSSLIRNVYLSSLKESASQCGYLDFITLIGLIGKKRHSLSAFGAENLLWAIDNQKLCIRDLSLLDEYDSNDMLWISLFDNAVKLLSPILQCSDNVDNETWFSRMSFAEAMLTKLFRIDQYRGDVLRILIQNSCNLNNDKLISSIECSKFLVHLTQSNLEYMEPFVFFFEEILHQWQNLPIISLHRICHIVCSLKRLKQNESGTLLIFIQKLLTASDIRGRVIGITAASHYISSMDTPNSNNDLDTASLFSDNFLSSKEKHDVLTCVSRLTIESFQDLRIAIAICDLCIFNISNFSFSDAEFLYQSFFSPLLTHFDLIKAEDQSGDVVLDVSQFTLLWAEYGANGMDDIGSAIYFLFFFWNSFLKVVTKLCQYPNIAHKFNLQSLIGATVKMPKISDTQLFNDPEIDTAWFWQNFNAILCENASLAYLDTEIDMIEGKDTAVNEHVSRYCHYMTNAIKVLDYFTKEHSSKNAGEEENGSLFSWSKKQAIRMQFAFHNLPDAGHGVLLQCLEKSIADSNLRVSLALINILDSYIFGLKDKMAIEKSQQVFLWRSAHSSLSQLNSYEKIELLLASNFFGMISKHIHHLIMQSRIGNSISSASEGEHFEDFELQKSIFVCKVIQLLIRVIRLTRLTTSNSKDAILFQLCESGSVEALQKISNLSRLQDLYHIWTAYAKKTDDGSICISCIDFCQELVKGLRKSYSLGVLCFDFFSRLCLRFYSSEFDRSDYSAGTIYSDQTASCSFTTEFSYLRDLVKTLYVGRRSYAVHLFHRMISLASESDSLQDILAQLCSCFSRLNSSRDPSDETFTNITFGDVGWMHSACIGVAALWITKSSVIDNSLKSFSKFLERMALFHELFSTLFDKESGIDFGIYIHQILHLFRICSIISKVLARKIQECIQWTTTGESSLDRNHLHHPFTACHMVLNIMEEFSQRVRLSFEGDIAFKKFSSSQRKGITKSMQKITRQLKSFESFLSHASKVYHIDYEQSKESAKFFKECLKNIQRTGIRHHDAADQESKIPTSSDSQSEFDGSYIDIDADEEAVIFSAQEHEDEHTYQDSSIPTRSSLYDSDGETEDEIDEEDRFRVVFEDSDE